MATGRRQSLFDVITATATRPGGLDDAKATRDKLRRLAAKKLPNAMTGVPSIRLDRRDRVTDAHVKTMASMIYSLSFAPLTVHTQIWCAWWWWPKEIAKLLEDIRFYGWGVSSLQVSESAGGSGSCGRGYLRRLNWVGKDGEWHEGEDLTPEGRKFFAEFLEMDLNDVPEGLKQVPYLPELMCEQICEVLDYDADQTKAICGPDWWCTCASCVELLRDHPHNFFCRRPVYDYTTFLHCPLDTLGLTSIADVKHLHVLYLPTVTKDDRFLAVVAYDDGRDLKADKKTEDLVFYLKALALADELPIPEDMINPQLMTDGLHNGATVALAEKGTEGAPCRSAVLFAGVEADLAKMVVACDDRGLKLERPPSASGTAQLHDIFANARVDEREGLFGAVRVDERRATALYGLAHRPAANRLSSSHKLSDAKILTMVRNHFRFFKYIEDEGASGLALKIYEDGIFKPTPLRKTPLTWLSERDDHGKYKFVDGSKLSARPWARVKLDVERGAQHVFLDDRSEQWKRSLGRHVRGLRDHWLKPRGGSKCLAESRRMLHDQLVRLREDLTAGMSLPEGEVRGCFAVGDRVLVAVRDIDVEVDPDLRRDASYYGEITSWNQSKLCWDVQVYGGTHFLRFNTLRRLALVGEGIGAAIIDGIEFFNRPPFVTQLDRIGGAEALLAGAVVLVAGTEFNEEDDSIGVVVARGAADGTATVLLIEGDDEDVPVCFDVALDNISRVVDAAGLDDIDAGLRSDAEAALNYASTALNTTPQRAVAEPEVDHRGQPKRRRIDPRRAQQERDEERERNRVRSCFELLGTQFERKKLCSYCRPFAYVSESGLLKDLGLNNYYSETPKQGYKPRGNAPFPKCYHVVNNTESGSLKLDRDKREKDKHKQHEAIGGR